jgi:Cft2 family RNA processing exonuclease
MRDNAVERLLSLFTSADRAEAIAGDLAQERDQHGWTWFWLHVARTTLALWRSAVTDAPVVVHATRETLDALKAHLFNWKIWPDFAQIPSPQAPYLSYEEIRVGEPVRLGGRTITPLPANHVVPAVGFCLDSGEASLVFTGDTTTNDAFWDVVNRIENLRYLIIETAFSDAERKLAPVVEGFAAVARLE